jgi:hypothetical protein
VKTWRQALRDGMISGGIAAAVSAAILAIRGTHENGSLLGPVNAVSHWIWGNDAAQHDRASIKYSLLGYGIHHGASVFWATLFEKWFGHHNDKQEFRKTIANGMAVSALANFVDYKMTPKRLQPGYEMRLSKKSLLAVYAAFGLGLALRSLLAKRK